MTIQSETNRWAYVLDGATTDYDYDQKIYESTDLVVQVYNTTTLATTTLTETTDYTVTGAGDDAGGTVVLVTPASYSAIHKLIIRRVLPLTQESDFVENTAFLADVIEEALDRSAIRDQQLQEQLDRAVKRDVTQTAEITLPEPEANKLVGWNAAGTDLENKVALYTDVQAAAEAAASDASGFADDASGFADDASGYADDAAASAASVPVFTRDTFADGDLSSGVLTITHNLGLSAPYTINIEVFDNNGDKIIPDDITGTTNSVAIDLTSYGTITGNYGYAYLAG